MRLGQNLTDCHCLEAFAFSLRDSRKERVQGGMNDMRWMPAIGNRLRLALQPVEKLANAAVRKVGVVVRVTVQHLQMGQVHVERSPRLKHADNLGRRRMRVWNVFQNVERKYQIEACIREGQPSVDRKHVNVGVGCNLALHQMFAGEAPEAGAAVERHAAGRLNRPDQCHSALVVRMRADRAGLGCRLRSKHVQGIGDAIAEVVTA